MKNLHVSVLKLVGFLSSCKNKIMKAHDVFYFIKLKTVISPCKGNWQSWIPIQRHGYCILAMSKELGFRIPVTIGIQNAWTFLVDSKAQDSRFQEKISRIPDSLIWSDSDPKINTFSVKLNPVNWTSTTTCRLRVHVVLVTECCSCH